MAGDLSAGLICTVAAVGFLVVVAAAVGTAIGSSRLRQRQHSKLLNVAKERHASRYPGSYISITMLGREDVPRVGRVLQRQNLYNPYSIRAWGALRSQESLQRRPIANETLARPSGGKIKPTPGGPLWPLPPRLTRSGRAQLSSTKAIPLGHLSPITERSANTAQNTPNLDPQPSHLSTIDRGEKLKKPVFNLPGELKPEPLFYGKQRSMSSGAIRDSLCDLKLNMQLSKELRLSAHDAETKPVLKRHLSLQSYRSGSVPTAPLPSPPSKLCRLDPIQNLRNHRPLSCSLDSSASTRNSVMDTDEPLQPTNENFTRIGAGFFLMSQSKRSPAFFHSDQWKWSGPNSATRTSGNSTTDNYSHAASQNSLRASVEQPLLDCNGVTLQRSASSSLSLGLVDKYAVSRNHSNASRFDGPQDLYVALPNASVPSRIRPDVRKDSGSSGQRSHDLALVHSVACLPVDSNKRFSTSTLQEISGKRECLGSGGTRRRPSSMGTANQLPIDWDDQLVVKKERPSAMKPRAEGHKRQSRQRIMYTVPVTPSKLAPTAEGIEEHEELSPGPRESRKVSSVEASVSQPRPPSIAIFDPQIEQTRTRSIGSSICRPSSTTLDFNMYKSQQNGSAESLFYTPTKNSNTKPRLSTRQSLGLNYMSYPASPILTPSQGVTIPSLGFLNQGLEDPNLLSPPGTPFSQHQFPKPPNWRIARGRRPQSPRLLSARTSPSRRAARGRSSLHNSTGPSPRSADSKGIRDTIIELRRMNSDVMDFTVTQLQQYRNMGDSNPLPHRSDMPVADEHGEPVVTVGQPVKDNELGKFGQQMMESARRNQVTQEFGVGGIELGTASTDWAKRRSGSILENECF